MARFVRGAVYLLGMLSIATALGCASSAVRQSASQYADDAAITTRVKGVIRGEPTLQAAQIKVETFKGEVQLSGFVSSPAAENRAIALARRVEGVVAVRNEMRLW